MIKVADKFILLSYTKESLVFYKNILSKFCITRGVSFIKVKETLKPSFDGVLFSGFLFFPFYKSVFITLSNNAIRNHKRKLKFILKHNLRDIVVMLKNINNEINRWNQTYYLLSYSVSIGYNLDLYIQKLLWKYIKKVYIKRSNKWIYNKYWRCINGKWNFFSFDSKKNVVFLISHKYSTFSSKHFFFSFDVFDYRNKRKFVTDSQFEFEFFSSSIIRFIYKRQKGLCFICKRPFLPIDLKFIKLSSLKTNNLYMNSYLISKVYLFHSDCSF